MNIKDVTEGRYWKARMLYELGLRSTPPTALASKLEPHRRWTVEVDVAANVGAAQYKWARSDSADTSKAPA